MFSNESTSVPIPVSFGDPAMLGVGVQRTMSLLASSTPERRNTVRLLYYGQSGMESGWCEMLTELLKQRFPHANLIIENRALGGFSSQRLVRTSETDLYTFYPDLMILNVLGADGDYEDIIRRTRERTTAEILILTNHVRKLDEIEGETNPENIVRGVSDWNLYFDCNFLPAVAKKYGCGFGNIREIWKRYLRDTGIDSEILLGGDKFHLGPKGCQVMAEIVNAYLTYRPELPHDDTNVQTSIVGKDIHWVDDKLTLDFTGNRVDVVMKEATATTASVTIDGTPPSNIPELYKFTRALATPGAKWPVILKITSLVPLLVEEWTMQVTVNHNNPKHYIFTVQGSLTGADGAGSSEQLFVSNSGRIVIDPADWDVEYALTGLPRIPIPDNFVVNWRVEPYFVDDIISPKIKDDGTETIVTLAQGLVNGQHTLEITGGQQTSIKTIRIYRPMPPVVGRVVE